MGRLGSRLAALYIRLCYRTGRWQVVGRQPADDLRKRNEPFILAFWHGRLLMLPCAWQGPNRIQILVSQHRDGDLIARALASLGIGTVRGSGRPDGKKGGKGGAAALRSMVKALHSGVSIGIAPDGPRGPRLRASEGIITVARLSGAPVVPIAYAASRRILFNSWDRFLLPLPFSRGVFVWGQPIRVPRGAAPAETERLRRAIEDGLNEVSDEADRLVGHGRAEPARLAGRAG